MRNILSASRKDLAERSCLSPLNIVLRSGVNSPCLARSPMAGIVKTTCYGGPFLRYKYKSKSFRDLGRILIWPLVCYSLYVYGWIDGQKLPGLRESALSPSGTNFGSVRSVPARSVCFQMCEVRIDFAVRGRDNCASMRALSDPRSALPKMRRKIGKRG